MAGRKRRSDSDSSGLGLDSGSENLDTLLVLCTNCGASITARAAQRGKCPECGEVPTVDVISGLDDWRIPSQKGVHRG